MQEGLSYGFAYIGYTLLMQTHMYTHPPTHTHTKSDAHL